MRWNRYRRDRQIIAAVLVFTVIVAAGIALSLYRVWTRPWFASRRRGVRAMSVVFAVALMSCLARLVL
ncbi:hypothetical protein HGK56_10540 [Klebsiella variicola]|uniref:hypothetical protein n=1 Tax=Klebsiella variicola TaxID=244366 RepID=UPI00143D925B|nr:hypothetical protein [Klebsiella variicola]MBA6174964.1 hypothetical protein [Klebsiella variicola]